MFPHRTTRGIRCLEDLGFRVKLGRHALQHQGATSDTAANRVTDLHEMFADDSVRVILSAIGGDHSCHLLPLLDFDLISTNPKIFVGYSDTTVLSVAIWVRTGLITYYGPALLTDFAEYPRMFDYTRDWFLRALSSTTPFTVASSAEWTDELLDWESKRDLERPRVRHVNPGWTWLKPGQCEGVLVGGCLESLQHLRGTSFWPDWKGHILFFETSNSKPATVDGILMDYQNMGVLDELAGLLVGRCWGYSAEERKELLRVLLERTTKYEFPIVADMDFGHTAPQLTLPIGCRAKIDSVVRSFELSEGPVA